MVLLPNWISILTKIFIFISFGLKDSINPLKSIDLMALVCIAFEETLICRSGQNHMTALNPRDLKLPNKKQAASLNLVKGTALSNKIKRKTNPSTIKEGNGSVIQVEAAADESNHTPVLQYLTVFWFLNIQHMRKHNWRNELRPHCK